MTYYERLKRKRLGDVLVEEGLLEREVVIRALQEQQLSRRLLSDILLESCDVPQYDLARVIAKQYQVPYVEVSTYSFHKDLVGQFPAELLHETGVLPLGRYGKQVSFVCQEVPSQEHADRLREHVEGGMYFFVGIAMEIKTALNDYAPVKRKDAPAELAAAPAAIEPEAEAELSAALESGELEQSSAWKELFDSANDAILSEIASDDEPTSPTE